MASRTGMFLKEEQRLELIKELTNKGELKPGIVSDDVLQNLNVATTTTNNNQQQQASTSGSGGSSDKEQPDDAFGTGCLACGEDDDHANLLLCEACNDEYHTYCLDPPLRSVPTGDWFCDRCKMPMEDDGLDALVCALPPKWTSRFGEVCWAQGGVGFGWWPAFIYDPRFTVGSARQLAHKNLGKRHLVYFFECHDAPFTVLPDSKISLWEDGMTDEYYLGRTAKASGKAKLKLFEQALQAAIVESGKPIAMRMNWNHTEQPQILPPPATKTTTTTTQKVPQQQQQQQNSNKKNKKDSKGKKRQRQEQQEQQTTKSNNNKKQTTKSSSKTRRRISDKQQKFGFISTDSPDTSSVEGGGGPSPHHKHHQYASRRVFSKGGVAMEGTTAATSAADSAAATAAAISNNGNITGNVVVAADAAGVINTTATAATQIESSEDGELICKLIKKCGGGIYYDGEQQRTTATTTTKQRLINIGFVKLKSRKLSTFADARIAIQQQLVPDCLQQQHDKEFKFFVPNLGPVSSKQELSLGPMFTFMKQTTTDTNLGSGHWNHPLKVLIVDSPFPTPPPTTKAAAATAATEGTTKTTVTALSNSSASAAAVSSTSTSAAAAVNVNTNNDGYKKKKKKKSNVGNQISI